MPTFLSDPPFFLILLLAGSLFVAAAVWFNRRDRRSLYALLGVAGVLALLLLLDSLFESPREEAVRRVRAIVAAVNARDPEAFAAQLADTFRYTGESGTPVVVTREQVRKAGFWELVKRGDVRVAAWDFSADDATRIDDDTIEIGFLAKGEAGGKQVPGYLRAAFTRQPDGQLRLTALASFHAMKRTNERQSLPYFP